MANTCKSALVQPLNDISVNANWKDHIVNSFVRALFKMLKLWKRLFHDIPPENMRNFSIIAHIDHGKSTLADRLLEQSGTIKKGSRVLDKLLVEQQRGITVKAQTASMVWERNGQKYLLNLIDTPGHVDFSYEVSRSLSACQGTLLLVDACQGIQAQTIANFYLAFGQDLSIVPVINKIDLPQADPDKISAQIEHTFEIPAQDCLQISAKSGLNCEKLFDEIIDRIPPPIADPKQDFSALLFDTWYDKYQGVVCLVAVKNGSIKKGDRIVSGHSKLEYDVSQVGVMYPDPTPQPMLSAGQVGYLTMNMKSTRDAFIGDTFYKSGKPTALFPGFHPSQPMVFAGLYPVDANDYHQLKESLDKLTLNDASVTVERETSSSLGQGFRLGFLGTLHMDVFRQRLEEEHDAQVINTVPTVPYIVRYNDGTEKRIRNPAEFPDKSDTQFVSSFLEPIVEGTLVFPDEYLGKMISMCQNHRGEQLDLQYIDANRVMAKYRFPMSEILTDFYDSLKSLSSGFASFDYQEAGYVESDLVKVTILLNKKPVDTLSCVVHRSHADRIGRDWASRLKEIIERQLFEIDIQASVQGRVICRETVKALRKDVTAKCYGGDITRKMKLLERQKEGKKRRKQLAGGVELSQEAFLALMTKKK